MSCSPPLGPLMIISPITLFCLLESPTNISTYCQLILLCLFSSLDSSALPLFSVLYPIALTFNSNAHLFLPSCFPACSLLTQC